MMKKENFTEAMSGLDDKYIAEAMSYKAKKRKPVWLTRSAAIAACMVLVLSVCLGSYAITAEAAEFESAVKFFSYYDMSTEGLTRGEIKAVYRDITTKSFTYSKTAEVIINSISAGDVGGFEIIQDNPTPEDIEKLWNLKNNASGFGSSAKEGLYYNYRSEYRQDPALGFSVHDKSYVEKYDGEALLWSVEIPEFWVTGYKTVSGGVIAYGETYTWSSKQTSNAWLAKIDEDGNLLWKKKMSHGFAYEYIAAIIENEDGSYAVFSRGELEYFCFSLYSANGEQIRTSKTEIGNYGIWNAARLGDGYIVQLGSNKSNEQAKIVKVDSEGAITSSFSYGSGDSYYYINDMAEFGGKIYLSAYAVPRLENEDQSAGGRHEIAGIFDYLRENYNGNMWETPSEVLTPIVRENYTAILLVCDPEKGTPVEFYSVKGSLGGSLSVSDADTLIWNTESITDTYLSPYTSAFSLSGTSRIFKYTFDMSGTLISQEKTEEFVSFTR